jgi:hypothetical protein
LNSAQWAYAVAPDGHRFLMNIFVDEPNGPPITIAQRAIT